MLRPRLSPQELMQHIKNTKVFDKVLKKVNVLSLENGEGLAELTVEEEHTNLMGTLDGGFSSMLVDHISSFAFSTHPLGNNYHVSVDMSLTFYKSAKIGDQIEVRANTLRGGRSLAFLEVLIRNKLTGDLLVKGNHTMFVMHPHEMHGHEQSEPEKKKE